MWRFSGAQVLGDRSIKLRYLNPNTLVVVTGLAPGMPAQDETSMQSTMWVQLAGLPCLG